MIILPSNRPVNTNLYSFELFITISFKYFNFDKNICLIHKFRVSQIRFLILMKITFEKRKRKGRLSYLKKGGYELSTPTMLFKELYNLDQYLHNLLRTDKKNKILKKFAKNFVTKLIDTLRGDVWQSSLSNVVCSFLKYVWIKKCMKICVMLFKM